VAAQTVRSDCRLGGLPFCGGANGEMPTAAIGWHSRILEFNAHHQGLWEPVPLLKRLVEEGKTSAQYTKEQTADA
jgi:hypothetical protein